MPIGNPQRSAVNYTSGMCGRYVILSIFDFAKGIPWLKPPAEESGPRYNVAPTQEIFTLANNADGRIETMRWGLIPSWAKDPSIGNRMINARAETLAEKPSFRTALRKRRCIIPASGFYEWRREQDGKTKTPMLIGMKSGEPFAFAGLWEAWRDPSQPDAPWLRSCTIITTTPNALMAGIHDRMPVILPPDRYRAWLEPDELDPQTALSMLEPYDAQAMLAHPVSKAVNNPRNDSPDCIVPVES